MLRTKKQQKITKSFLKRLGRLGVLLGIKESYLFSKNLLGLGVHPIKTLRQMEREKDRSQQVLVWGLPFYIFSGGVFLVYLGRRFLGRSVEWGGAAKLSMAGVMGISGLIVLYLGYWFYKIRRARYE